MGQPERALFRSDTRASLLTSRMGAPTRFPHANSRLAPQAARSLLPTTAPDLSLECCSERRLDHSYSRQRDRRGQWHGPGYSVLPNNGPARTALHRNCQQSVTIDQQASLLTRFHQADSPFRLRRRLAPSHGHRTAPAARSLDTCSEHLAGSRFCRCGPQGTAMVKYAVSAEVSQTPRTGFIRGRRRSSTASASRVSVAHIRSARHSLLLTILEVTSAYLSARRQVVRGGPSATYHG